MREIARRPNNAPRRANVIAAILALAALSACASGDPMDLIPAYERQLIAKDARAASASGPISIEEMLSRARGGVPAASEPNETILILDFAEGQTSPNADQRRRIAHHLRRIEASSRDRAWINAGPGDHTQRVASAVASLRRARVVADLVASSLGEVQVRYDPDLAAGRITLEIRKAPAASDA